MLMQKQAPHIHKAGNKISQKTGVHLFFGQKRRFSRRHAGFSLIEILVVVSIIGILLSIGVAVASKMTSEARREQTRAMMNGLLSANDEYKAIRGSGIPVDGSSSDSSTEQFVDACLTIKTCEEIMLSSLSSSTSASFERTYKNGTIFDRWGTEIVYRPSNNGSGTSPDPGVSNADLPISRDPFFASAGPDETWGTDDDITTLQ